MNAKSILYMTINNMEMENIYMNDSLCDREYKDDLPLNTINRIRDILGNLDILTTESEWKNSANGFYSVRVSVENTNLGTNGKGVTKEYALASAYGEFMERLQNGTFFKLSLDMSEEALKYKGFYYAPDERYCTIEELLNSKDEWIRIQLNNLDNTIDKKELLEKWLGVSYEKVSSDFACLPYINLVSGKISYIPIKMISKMYMSNGMCAGNTIEEALIQGLSEIFERVVNKAIIKEKIIPPTIPVSYLKNFPKIFSMIKEIESRGNFKVIIKDCSLEKGYPVVGIIFINKDRQDYFIKFGSHPIFEIAVERTLTELLQGQDIHNMMGLKSFSYKSEIKDDEQNLINILTNGSGIYPTELFSNEFTYEFKKLHYIKVDSTNKELLRYMINLLKNKGYDILIRDVSYLGFPSYHIIIPRFSEIEVIDDLDTIQQYSKYNEIKLYIRNLDKISEKELQELVSYFNEIQYSRYASITELLSIPVNKLFSWYYSNIDLFLCAIYYKMGRFYEAYKQLDKYLSYVKTDSYNDNIQTYYKCVRDYIGTRIDNLSENSILDILCKFYPDMMVKEIMMIFNNEKNIFTQYGQIKCWNCKDCDFKNVCMYPLIEKIYKNLKDKYLMNQINQRNIIQELNV